jgi:dTDP-glucose 4,6-dehydratase
VTKKIAIIGSNSFSGASFAKHMANEHYDVMCLSRSDEPIDALLPYKWGNAQDCRFFKLDLNRDLEKIESLLDSEKPTHIYNFAAQSMVGQSWDFPEHWFMTNAVSTIKFHNILRQKDYLDRYIHISTPEVYGSCEGYVAEEQRLNPSTPYAVSRAAADMSLKTFHDVYQFPVVSTRAANVFGPGQQLYRIIPRTILYILLGRKLQLHGGGYSERSFIHIDDVSCATRLIGEQGDLGGVYHIATNRQVSIRQLVQLICEKLSVDFDNVVEETGDRKGKDAAYTLDSSKLRSQLKWQDKVSLELGIEETISWCEKYFPVLKNQPLDYIHKA